MSLTQASDTENMQVKINSDDKQSKNGDQQIEGMSVSDAPDFQDPAILVVRETVRICYTREELMKLRDVPLSRKKPDFFNNVEMSVSILDPDRWNFEKRKPQAGSEGESSSDHRRRSAADPRERLRKEEVGGGLVLSPQRRSFNSGCFVPVRIESNRSNQGQNQQQASGRAHSPMGKGDSHISIREIQPSNNRRIGSGRILRDSWDFGGDKSDVSEDYFRGGQQRSGGVGDRDEKFERRGFNGREFETSRESDKERRNSARYDRRRVSDNKEQEEPEWFSSGPISQNDTIELRGFDDSEKIVKRRALSRAKRVKDWSKKKAEAQPTSVTSEESEELQKATTPDKNEEENKHKAENVKDKVEEKKDEAPGDKKEATNDLLVNDQSFNFDDILKCDTLPGLLTNGVGADGDTQTKSRFSRWFKQESPEKQTDSRRSSIHDDHLIIKDLLKDISETSVNIPGDSDAYFAPISPAGNTSNVNGNFMSRNVSQQQQASQSHQQQPQQGISIMEMLLRGKVQHQAEPVLKQQGVSGKILSLDELEAKIRHNADLNSGVPQKQHVQQKPDEEMTAAFKKLLAQAQAAGGGHPATSNGPMNKTQPMSLLEMLNHSQQQDEVARLAAAAASVPHHLLGPPSPGVNHQLHHLTAVNELTTLKLQQAQYQQKQMEMFNKLVNATTGGQMRQSPLLDVGSQQNRELLNRPEAQAILQAMHQRIPSPRELQVHTQNILQRALIKKKLEEQQENYRKKQEMQQQQQRGQSPNVATSSAGGAQHLNSGVTTKSISSPTPLAFTPTSVLRKMTAEKDEGKENKVIGDMKVPLGRPLTGMRPQPPPPQNQQWNHQFSSIKQPPGRPIVKANNNYQTQTPEQFFNQHQQLQQRMFNQAIQAVATAQQPQQQQRKAPNIGPQYGGALPPSQSSQYPYPNSANQQFAQQQLTQQQLRAQHQHRPANQQPQQQQMAGYQQQQGGQHQQQTQGTAMWQQFFNSTQSASRTSTSSINSNSLNTTRSGALNNGGDMSPITTNQLARWFSPDLLERARGGELPSTAGLAQHVLSLEEIERQTAPPVHN